ncbi:MAG TPA: hypothetical protein VN903_39340, partial [Polyangia bacterium]|nr:hypothetical protein [Polyangia bacterium]
KPRWPNLEPVVWAWRAGIESAAVIQAAWDRHETPDLENAAGFTLYVGRRAISAWHLEKIAGFVDDTAGFQTPLRRLCRAIAREVGGDRAIYMPDSAYPLSAVGYNAIHDGAAFDEIVRQLQQDFKPPAPTIRAIMTEHDNGDWDVDGYFIDDFADLINDVSATVRR